MVIRVLEADDAAEYQATRAMALLTGPLAFGMDYESFIARSLEDIQAQLPPVDNLSFTLGAFIDGKLVGTAGLFRHKLIKFRHGADLNAMYVADSTRGKGVGKALVAAVIERARTFEGLEMISLTATHTLTVAIEMYRKAGFETWGHSKRTMKVGDEYAEFVHMTLVL
jgi:GNAT superfamily N-acetyltransferase